MQSILCWIFHESYKYNLIFNKILDYITIIPLIEIITLIILLIFQIDQKKPFIMIIFSKIFPDNRYIDYSSYYDNSSYYFVMYVLGLILYFIIITLITVCISFIRPVTIFIIFSIILFIIKWFLNLQQNIDKLPKGENND